MRELRWAVPALVIGVLSAIGLLVVLAWARDYAERRQWDTYG